MHYDAMHMYMYIMCTLHACTCMCAWLLVGGMVEWCVVSLRFTCDSSCWIYLSNWSSWLHVQYIIREWEREREE